MNNWKLTITAQCIDELKGIRNYIQNELLMPETAQKQYGRIKQALLDLVVMPERNPLLKNEPWRSKGIRRAIIDNYAIYYMVITEKQEVKALHVFYGGRDFEKML